MHKVDKIIFIWLLEKRRIERMLNKFLTLRLDSHDKSFELCFLSKVFSFQAIKWYQIYRLYRLIKWWLASKQHHFVILCVLFCLLNFTYIGIFVRKYHILPQICCYNCFWSINKMRIKLYLWCTKFIFLGKPRTCSNRNIFLK